MEDGAIVTRKTPEPMPLIRCSTRIFSRGLYRCSNSEGCLEVESSSWKDSKNMLVISHNLESLPIKNNSSGTKIRQDSDHREICTVNIGVFSSSVGDDSPVKEEETDHQTFDDNQQLEGMDQQQLLPGDLIFDILLRQSDKHLAQLKLVSKAWYFMISSFSPPSPYADFCGFIYFTRRSLTTTISAKFSAEKGSSKGSKFGSQIRLMGYDIAQDFQDCCNGLFLLARSSAVPIQYSVFNPSTRECITLPINPNHSYSEINYASLAFDPISSLSYRVIRLSRSPYDATVSSPPMLDIFWSETGTWSNHCIPLDPRVYGFKWFKRTIYFNGVLYKLSRAKFLICIETHDLNLKASALELPERDKIDHSGFIGTSRGCLYYSHRVNSSMLLWVLEDNNGLRSWVLKNNIDLIYIIEHPALVFGSYWKRDFLKIRLFETYALHPHSDEVFMGTPDHIIRYHPQTKHMELIYKADKEDYIVKGQHMVFPYARCLAIINSVFQRRKCNSKLKSKLVIPNS